MSMQKKLLQPRKPKAQKKPRSSFHPPAGMYQGWAKWKQSKHARGRKL
jgi:hypothetical protein